MRVHSWVGLPPLVIVSLVPIGTNAAKPNRQPDVIAGVVSPMLKVAADADPPLATRASIAAAGNEFESFQVFLRAVKNDVTVTGYTFAWTSGTPAEVRLGRVGTVKVTTPSNVEGAVGCPSTGCDLFDPIFPDREPLPGLRWDGVAVTEAAPESTARGAFPWTVRQGERALFWAEVFVPAGTASGPHAGTLTLLASGVSGGRIEVKVDLLVQPFVLPASSTIPAWMRLNETNVCRSITGTANCGSGDYHAISAVYARFLLQHRITITPYDRYPGATNPLGSYRTWYGRYLGDPSNPDPYRNSLSLKDARFSAIEYPWSYDYAQTDPALRRAPLVAWWSNLDPAWQTIVNPDGTTTDVPVFEQIADEPSDDPNAYRNRPDRDWANIPQRADDIRSADPSGQFRTLVTTNITALDRHPNVSWADVDILSPVHQHLHPVGGSSLRGDYDLFLSVGEYKALWAYQSCMAHGCGIVGTDPDFTNWPNLMIDASGVQARAQPWMHARYDAPGLLYYDVAAGWSEPAFLVPFERSMFDRSSLLLFAGNGDGTLLYPGNTTWRPAGAAPQPGVGGTTHIPLASVRLKMLRDGLEDWEYFRLCERKNASLAARIVEETFPDLRSASSYPNPDPVADAERVRDARERLADCIVRRPKR